MKASTIITRIAVVWSSIAVFGLASACLKPHSITFCIVGSVVGLLVGLLLTHKNLA